MNFKRLHTKKFQRPGSELTPESIYWKQLSVPTLVKEFGAIDYIDFCPVEPHYFAVTCSVRVQIYNPITKLVAKNLSRFQENAYGGSFRQDGKLLVAGDEEGFVKLFDTASKNVLRFFKGHKGAVHRTFFTPDLLNIASFSDDKTVKFWDVATEKAIHTFEEHSDYIRAGCVNPTSSNIIISGGYDNLIKMYDTRVQQVSFSVNHESPVESLLFLPSGGIFISAGGTEVRVWDAFAGGKLLARLSQHHKTVTCLRLGSNGKRLFSGGLDRHVKIYDVASYTNVHTLNFPNAVLSLGISPNDQTVVAGMVDGLMSIQNMEKNSKDKDPIKKQKRISYFDTKFDHVVPEIENVAEAKYDYWLRKFEYVKCLDSCLNPYVMKKNTHVTVSVFQELIRRKGLHRAVAGRSQNSLAKIIKFIKRNINEYRFMRVLTDAASIILDVYEESFHEFTAEMITIFEELSDMVKKEVDLTYKLLELQGALELITSATDISNDFDETIQFTRDESNLKQSDNAKQTSIVIV